MKLSLMQVVRRMTILFTFLMVIHFVIGFGSTLTLVLSVSNVFQLQTTLVGQTFFWIVAVFFLIAFSFNLVEYFHPTIKWIYLMMGYLFFPISIPYVMLKKYLATFKKPLVWKDDRYCKQDFFLFTIILSGFMMLAMLSLTGTGVWSLNWNPNLGWSLMVSGLGLFILLGLGLVFNALNFRYNKQLFYYLAFLGIIINWVYLLWIYFYHEQRFIFEQKNLEFNLNQVSKKQKKTLA